MEFGCCYCDIVCRDGIWMVVVAAVQMDTRWSAVPSFMLLCKGIGD